LGLKVPLNISKNWKEKKEKKKEKDKKEKKKEKDKKEKEKILLGFLPIPRNVLKGRVVRQCI